MIKRLLITVQEVPHKYWECLAPASQKQPLKYIDISDVFGLLDFESIYLRFLPAPAIDRRFLATRRVRHGVPNKVSRPARRNQG